MKKMFVAAVAIACSVLCSEGIATPVTWHFTGLVNEGDIPHLFFPFTVVPGDSVTIDLSLEPTTPCDLLCGPTLEDYRDPLTALSFEANGTRFDFPLTSSSLTLAKDEPPRPGYDDYLNVFDLSFNGFDAGSGIYYAGTLALQGDALMPPVPGINDVHLANLVVPNPADFVSEAPNVDTNFFDVEATPNGGFFDGFGGQTLSSSVVQAPEPSTHSLWVAAGLAFVLLLGCRRARARRRSG